MSERVGVSAAERSPSGQASLRDLVRDRDPEPEHAFQVCMLALALFDATQELHGLGAEERALLEAGALLHDIGFARSASRHHKHSRDIVLSMDWPGAGPREKAVVACVARYHRKAHPRSAHKIFRNLSPTDQELVTKLAALLRLADGLDRTHTAAAESVRVDRLRQGIRLVVTQRRPTPTDIWGAMRKRELFEQAFGCSIDVVPAQ